MPEFSEGRGSLEENSQVQRKKIDMAAENGGPEYLSWDYSNRLLGFYVSYERGGFELVKEVTKSHQIRFDYYEEKYLRYGYQNIVTEANREIISELDALADEFNRILDDIDNVDEAIFIEMYNRMLDFLIAHRPPTQLESGDTHIAPKSESAETN